jgi:Rrf2 family transcriptional regulator, iron-sulfur cluster assembly transcription factor
LKLTTRGHYSVKALLDLSLQPSYGPAPVKAIAQRQSLPAPYLEKLLIEMRQAGLVNSVRGAQGGYQLARKPAQIFVGQILAAVGESITYNYGTDAQYPAESPGDRAADWVTLSLWRRLNAKMQNVLDTISLADLYYDARSWQAAQGEGINYTV